MLYTDGLVEAPGRDIDAGIDRLLGEATRLVASRFQERPRNWSGWSRQVAARAPTTARSS